MAERSEEPDLIPWLFRMKSILENAVEILEGIHYANGGMMCKSTFEKAPEVMIKIPKNHHILGELTPMYAKIAEGLIPLLAVSEKIRIIIMEQREQNLNALNLKTMKRSNFSCFRHEVKQMSQKLRGLIPIQKEPSLLSQGRNCSS